MLQQTRVETVIDYYHRFLARYPTLESLAQASLDEVLKVWEGLGYYARARNLHRAARIIQSEHAGRFPDTLEAVCNLPGIGRSTAGAILTFAFKKPHPILDGNVKRILSRLDAIEQPLTDAATIQRLWERSQALLPSDAQDALAFNQGIMDLGATICLPKRPNCSCCPWKSNCHAFLSGRQSELPMKSERKVLPHYTVAVGVIWRENRVLIALRPEHGLLGGLWEFPGGKCHPEESLQDCLKREVAEETGLIIEVGAPIARVKHAYSHFKITLHAFECRYLQGEAVPRASQALRWVTLDEIGQYAFPKASKKVLDVLQWNHDRPLAPC